MRRKWRRASGRSALLRQARGNLTGDGRDLWVFGLGAIRDQSADLERFAQRLDADHATLRARVSEAKRATDEFASWIEGQLPRKTGPSGVGVEHYDWYLRNVHLVPYTWREQLVLVERELAGPTPSSPWRNSAIATCRRRSPSPAPTSTPRGSLPR